jgi:hypothetical protein
MAQQEAAFFLCAGMRRIISFLFAEAVASAVAVVYV